ncbi:tapasin [Trichomycterus rosablanca]|uniref:tapasin n=1 Tax=Trichomycterus rosablanca TaxID=2290929 RepID=UPI002F35F15D
MNIAFCGLVLGILCSADVSGSQSEHDVRWLPCQFRDETRQINVEGVNETKFHFRNAVLQFGNPGDHPVHNDAITFLVTTSKVDMRHYMKGGEDMVECEIHRYNTGGIVMRWPGFGAQDNDVWFTCVLHHTKGQFVLTTFLRHTPAQEGYQEKIQIGDQGILTTSASMIVLTNTPTVHVGLLKEQTLHCQFAVDHKSPNVTVEWRFQRRGERTLLFSHYSRTGKSQGSGVSVKTLGTGNASLKIPLATQSNEGTYMCSVLVPPLYGSNDITLSIQEPPRVSLNVDTSLSLPPGGEQKVVCNADGYYPLDVNIEWLQEPVGSNLLPVVLKNILYSSHRHNKDGTYSFSAFFLLQPSIDDSGSRYTCRVNHQALRTPIRKSFTLVITDEESALWYFLVFVFILVMVGILIWLLPQLFATKRQAPNKLW